MRYMVVNPLKKLSLAVVITAMAIGMALPADANAAAEPKSKNVEAQKNSGQNVSGKNSTAKKTSGFSSLTRGERQHLYDGNPSARDKSDALYNYGKKSMIKDKKSIIATILGFVVLLAGFYAFSEHTHNVIKRRKKRKIIKSQQKYSAHGPQKGRVGGIHTKTKITKQEVEEKWK